MSKQWSQNFTNPKLEISIFFFSYSFHLYKYRLNRHLCCLLNQTFIHVAFHLFFFFMFDYMSFCEMFCCKRGWFHSTVELCEHLYDYNVKNLFNISLRLFLQTDIIYKVKLFQFIEQFKKLKKTRC